ncbi:glycerophosphodiester phosphodiesterase [Ferrimonas pelagia]|uniref:Glycerophosphodiester phosphodiesterase n=1 Tax=Ferrimonas pelagia TaxID=1177826 RepID=A0ABP9E8D3_9GAMM
MRIIAHRGASGEAPENTLTAMDLAIEQDACAIELDVHQLEGTLVVLHDRYLNKTTSGSGLLSDSSLDVLSTLDAGEGQRVPTLWQVLERIGGRCDLNIELKGMGTVEPLLALLQRAEAELGYRPEQFLISSFHHPMLAQLKRQRPALKIGALTACCPLNYAEFATALGAFSVHMDVDFADPAFIADAKARGLKIYVYTVDHAPDLLRLDALGVDGIFSNYPGRSRARLNAPRHQPGQVWQ